MLGAPTSITQHPTDVQLPAAATEPPELVPAAGPSTEDQLRGLGVARFKLHDVDSISTKLLIDQESIFYELGSGGLISFSDYIFLLTVLSTSRRYDSTMK